MVINNTVNLTDELDCFIGNDDGNNASINTFVSKAADEGLYLGI